jgi:hypothetical protein
VEQYSRFKQHAPVRAIVSLRTYPGFVTPPFVFSITAMLVSAQIVFSKIKRHDTGTR